MTLKCSTLNIDCSNLELLIQQSLSESFIFPLLEDLFLMIFLSQFKFGLLLKWSEYWRGICLMIPDSRWVSHIEIFQVMIKWMQQYKEIKGCSNFWDHGAPYWLVLSCIKAFGKYKVWSICSIIADFPPPLAAVWTALLRYRQRAARPTWCCGVRLVREMWRATVALLFTLQPRDWEASPPPPPPPPTPLHRPGAVHCQTHAPPRPTPPHPALTRAGAGRGGPGRSGPEQTQAAPALWVGGRRAARTEYWSPRGPSAAAGSRTLPCHTWPHNQTTPHHTITTPQHLNWPSQQKLKQNKTTLLQGPHWHNNTITTT